jgi:hypothetical protein
VKCESDYISLEYISFMSFLFAPLRKGPSLKVQGPITRHKFLYPRRFIAEHSGVSYKLTSSIKWTMNPAFDPERNKIVTSVQPTRQDLG